jgi:hypothetical protein
MEWTGEPARTTPRRGRLRQAACLAVPLAAALSGCIVGDNKCSANQVELTGDAVACACAPGAVPDPRGYGCVMCGEHEQVVSEKCECEMGFHRPSPDAACEETTGGVLGAACNDTMPCAEPYPYCASAGAESFCTTQGCAGNDECETGWRCNTPGAGGFCEQPAGLGKACEAPADCAGTEATFCESFVTHSCIIEKCLGHPEVCPSGNVCCDMTALVGSSLCTPSMVLMGGMCPDGKAPVSQ